MSSTENLSLCGSAYTTGNMMSQLTTDEERVTYAFLK